MSIREVIQKQIADLESKIASQQGDVAALKSALSQLQLQDFEEDLRESGDQQQLLNG